MSGHEYPPPGGMPPPPPGWQPGPPGVPPYAGPPSYAPPPAYAPPPSYAPPPGWQPGPGMLGAAHKPGAIPLRPLGLGDLYDGAFKVIRYNPKATVGASVLVAAIAMAIPVLVTAVLTWTVDLTFDESGSGSTEAGDVLAVVGSVGSIGLGLMLQSFGLLLVSGMIAHVVMAAAIGRRLTLGEAWRATHGKRWRLIGLSVLLGLMTAVVTGLYVGMWVVAVVVTEDALPLVLFGLVSVPLFVAFLCWFWTRLLLLPAPALMLEDVGVLGALGRGFRLTRRAFWRTFGIALLTVIVAQFAGGLLATPISFGGQLVLLQIGPEYQLLGLVLLQALTSVLSAAFVTPFTTAVTALQYVDLRMRKEAFDVELMTRAGITAS